MDNNTSNPLIEDHQAGALANCRDVLAFVQLTFEGHSEEVILNQQARQGLLVILAWVVQTLQP